jgi:hypothetical protein
VSVILISLRVIGRDAADADNICVQFALQSNCTIVENLDDGESSSRMSGGQKFSFLSLFVLLEDDEYSVSNFVCVIQALSIFVGIVLNCLPLMKSFLSFPIDDYLLMKDEIISEGQLRWRIGSMSRSCDLQCKCACLDEGVNVFTPIGFKDCCSKLFFKRSKNVFHDCVCL